MAGKNQKKPGKGREKTERKTAKAADKRARRDEKKLNEEDDIDAILANIQREAAKNVAVHVEENVPPPSPRCNCTVTVNPMKETELILYGGEYYNGIKTYVYGDLYRYSAEKGTWKLVSSPNSPHPRSGHQAVGWKSSIFVFGGEFTSPNQERFHHYKDLWRFDLITNAWEQLPLKGCPGPRSGHRMVLYKHRIILFGGFYDTLREVRYFNDLYVLDLDEYKWQEVKPKLGSLWPSPRSGFHLAVHLDEIFLYGGYFKESNSDKNSSEKGIVHSDMWRLNPQTWEWSKVKKLGIPPGPRAGFSVCTHKKRAILFGGVVDREDQGDVLHSTFLNELYAFQMDNERWYPLELRKAKQPKQKKLNGLPSEAGEGACARRDCELDDSSHCEQLADRVAATTLDVQRDDSIIFSNLPLFPSSSDSNQVVKPCGRINSCLAVGKDILFLYGGMMEIGDREMTLDDLYALNLNKLDEWRCLIEGTKSEWIEPNEEDEDEDEEDDEMDSECPTNEKNNDEIEVEDGKGGLYSAAQETAVMLRGEGKKMLRKERRSKIGRLRTELGLADIERTPQPGENLKDFFSRTSMYWQMAAYEHTQHTGKELRKDGFDLAEGRYIELKPVLEELAKLEAEQKADEENETSTLQSKAARERARHLNGC